MRRWRVLMVAAMAALLLSGCVWSRLLSLKNQLADFDTQVEVLPDGPGLYLRLREPVVRPSDIAWLFGGDPSSSVDGRHVLRFTHGDLPAWELLLIERDGLVGAVMLPQQLFHLLPRERLIALMRAFGSAEVDRSRREASTALARDASQPLGIGRDILDRIFGVPDVEVPDGTDLWLHYRMRLEVPDGEPPLARIEVLLTGGRVTRIRIVAARFSVWLRLADPPVAAPTGR
jgi:hypothetical protein